MGDQAKKAMELRELHRPGDPLVLVNVWDVASARTVADAPGCRALSYGPYSSSTSTLPPNATLGLRVCRPG